MNITTLLNLTTVESITFIQKIGKNFKLILLRIQIIFFNSEKSILIMRSVRIFCIIQIFKLDHCSFTIYYLNLVKNIVKF